MNSAVRTATDWMFRDRASGKLVIAQRPNVPLTVWLVCILTDRLLHLTGAWSRLLNTVGTTALVIWAGDEVARGVNPWRRALGAGVLLALLIAWAMPR